MIEKEFVVESMLKEKMMIKSLDILIEYIESRLNVKINFFNHNLKSDCLRSLLKIKDKKSFNYLDVFIFLMTFNEEYERVKSKILSGDFDLNENFKREDYWENEKIDFNEALFFTYVFFTESYKTKVSIDFQKMSEKFEKTDNVKDYHKIYLSYINKIKKEEGLI